MPDGGAVGAKGRGLRITAVMVVLLLVAGALFLAFNYPERPSKAAGAAASPNHPPVVVLMDTTAPDGTYDDDNKKIGASNAKEVAAALEAEGVAVTSHPVPLYAGWKGEAEVIS